MNDNRFNTPYFQQQPDIENEWAQYFRSDSENTFNMHSLCPPAPGVSEIAYEKPFEDSMPIDEIVCFTDEDFAKNFAEEIDFSEFETYTSPQAPHFPEIPRQDEEASQCSNCRSEQEEVGSISTRDSMLYDNTFDGDSASFLGESFTAGSPSFDPETELNRRAINFLQGRPDEEKAYIEKIYPLLLESLKEIYIKHQLPLDDHIISSILHQLLKEKQNMIGAERQVFDQTIEEEMIPVREQRPSRRVNDQELINDARKEKRAPKGNRNASALNHLNENYVSNIFQFAKRNYPDDKEIQRIGSERNVSASSFRRMMGPQLTDDIMTRKAKARIMGSGKELVSNVEYWMRDGYFDQCADREKYIYHKEKALRDLALSGKY